MPVALQVAVIYAATNGFVDSVPVGEILDWEKKFTEYMQSAHGAVLEKVVGGWDDEIEKALQQAVSDFNYAS